MKKYYSLLILPSQLIAAELQVSLELLDGTYVGEPKFYYDLPYSDSPGFYYEENSLEFGIGVKYIHDFENWDLFVKAAMGTSELRNSRTSELGIRYRPNQNHWVSVKYKGTYAKEEYEIDQRIIDPEHQNTITNGEWAMWAIARYRLNLNQYWGYPFYVGVEASKELNSPELMEDEFSMLAGFHHDMFFAELKAGEDLVAASLGLSFEMLWGK